MEPKKIELIELERQLSCPTGDNGIKVAENMNYTNIKMTLSSIENLELKNEDSILEIGHGNCGHLSKILEKGNAIQYFGLEISDTMKNEAERINKDFILNNTVNFQIYDGNTIPFPDNSFDKLFTVNTIYFWSDPISFLNEIFRVLKSNGIFTLTFAQKKFMQSLPFVKDKFMLYNNDTLKELISKTNFIVLDIINKTENVESKIGDFVEREFTVMKLTKK
ncbi:hypothetical protein SY27_07210 [Flavobacterium sp. 316]|uniref:class I SAM-dependent methyltransferase n=1 Tax=Flavobacterium sp. 316 TaxID=1603293 RepID=UPI0005DD3073|nr:class I SAM-dependent methyltransferase [Flavobacterium sp. 316]KIX21488.1 hypothetical protein SY27_07210 [Flavobacterium sp. 316]